MCFVGVKDVDDVLAWRSGALRSRQGRLTCLLGVEQGLHDFFIGVKGVDDVLAGVDQGVEEFFAVVKGVGDVLAGRGAGC